MKKDVLNQVCTDVVPRPAISALHGSLLEMKIIKSYRRPPESGSPEWIQLVSCDLISPPGDSDAC